MNTGVIMHNIWSIWDGRFVSCGFFLFSYSQAGMAAQLSDHVIRLSFVTSMFVLISFPSIIAPEETWPAIILRDARFSILGLFFLYTKKLLAILLYPL